jgi:multicomponent K+:H+ antiporter subunit E
MRVIHALAFIVFYLWEIAYSTLRIALLLLRPKLQLQSRFVEVPLDLEGSLARFLYACLISMTPGSMSVALDDERDILIVHLIDAPDEEEGIRELKKSFETPLIRIFGKPSNKSA